VFNGHRKEAMNQRHLSPRIALICLVTLLGGSTVVHGQLLPLASTGSLGAWSFPAGYTYKLNTDNLTIDRCAGSVCSWETWNGSTWVPAASGVPVARVVTQAGGPEIAVFDFTTFNLPPGVTLTVEGTRAGAIAATGDVTIAGILVVTATGGAGGIAPSPVDGTGGVSAQGPGAGGAGLGPGRMILPILLPTVCGRSTAPAAAALLLPETGYPARKATGSSTSTE
jgi:hypothetical protein